MKMLVTRPQYDIPTRYLSAWAEEIIDFAKKKGVDVVDLAKEKANKNDFIGRMQKIRPDIVFLNGHGDDDCVTGHDYGVLIKAHENDDLLVGLITYALSCNSGKSLGVKVAANKNTTYIGYKDKFALVCSADCITKPLTDNRARPFMESSNQVMISLLKGNRAQDASDRSKGKFREHYRKLLSSGSDPDARMDAQCLWWNLLNQVCLGDLDARLK